MVYMYIDSCMSLKACQGRYPRRTHSHPSNQQLPKHTKPRNPSATDPRTLNPRTAFPAVCRL